MVNNQYIHFGLDQLFHVIAVYLASLASTAGIGLEQTNDLKSGISIISEQSKYTDQKAGSRDDKCSICLCDFTDKKTLSKCGHSFCAGCIDEAFKIRRSVQFVHKFMVL